MELKNKKVTIIGAAKSGLAAAQLILELKGTPKISDKEPFEKLPKDVQSWITKNKISAEYSGHIQKFIEDSDLLVISPGVRRDALPVQWAKAKKIPVMGEVELAFRFCQRPVIAVTGSNGKTTVSTLIRDVIEKSGKKACLCGNVGNAFSNFVLRSQEYDYFVLEISSFQLETIVDFKPFIAVFLNFNQNHLDRHADLEEYFQAKKRIFLNQGKNDFAVLNAADPAVSLLKKEVKAQVRYFNDPKVPQKFNNPNFLAALEVAKILNIKEDVCADVFTHFKGVEHRIEMVRNIHGVDFINDSKSTTAEAALERISKPIIMICGGRDKHIDFTVLRDLVPKKVKKMFVIGESKEKIKASYQDLIKVEECATLQEAVTRAQQSASTGDCILLSPMCTSFDMFSNFEERGKVFKEIVNNLKEKALI